MYAFLIERLDEKPRALEASRISKVAMNAKIGVI
jgi:hypothetical protein